MAASAASVRWGANDGTQTSFLTTGRACPPDIWRTARPINMPGLLPVRRGQPAARSPHPSTRAGAHTLLVPFAAATSHLGLLALPPPSPPASGYTNLPAAAAARPRADLPATRDARRHADHTRDVVHTARTSAGETAADASAGRARH